MATDALEANTADAVAALYAGSLGAFVGARDALARDLRAAGRRDEATAVKALRKPSLAAWALDAGRAADPAAIEDLAAAASTLAGGPADLRAAIAGLREAEARVVDVAVAAAAGHDQSTDPSAVTQALRAVVADPEALADLRAGRLVAIPAAGGLGVALPGAPAAPREAPAPSRPRPARAAHPAAPAKEKAPQKATAAPREAPAPPARAPRVPPARLAAAERAVARAEAAADAAAAAADEAGAAAADADAEVADAERAVAAARRRVEAARKAAGKARDRAAVTATRRDEAEDKLAEARARLDDLAPAES
jgi:hypothetical protein